MKTYFRQQKPSTQVLFQAIRVQWPKVLFIVSNDFIQIILEAVVLGITYQLVSLLQNIPNTSLSQLSGLGSFFGFSIKSRDDQVMSLLIILPIVIIFQSALKYTSRISGQKIAAEIKEKVLTIMANIMMRCDYLKLQSLRIGNTITVCTEAPEAIRQQFELYSALAVTSMYSIVYIFILAVYSWSEFLVSFFCLIVLGGIQIYLSLLTKRRAVQLAINLSNTNNSMTGLIRGFKFLKSSSSTELALSGVREDAAVLKRSYLSTAKLSELVAPLSKSTGAVVISIAAFMFIYSSENIFSALPQLSIFIIALQRLVSKANESFSLVKDLAQNRGRLLLYDQFIDNFSDSSYFEDSRPINSQLTFDQFPKASNVISQTGLILDIAGLTFCYPSSSVASLKSFDSCFRLGDFVAVVGQSGSGKSTFVDLLTGLLAPSSGSISINGMSICEHSDAKYLLCKNLFLVDQDGFISHGSIRQNIIWSSSIVDTQKLWCCLEIVNLDQYVATLPKGIDTIIGEGGTKMSGGQAQRICIARALYQDKQILILDEATSSLDQNNEQEILQKIHESSLSKIVIMITHNLNNLKYANKCICLHNGSMVSCGSAEQVLSYMKVNEIICL